MRGHFEKNGRFPDQSDEEPNERCRDEWKEQRLRAEKDLKTVKNCKDHDKREGKKRRVYEFEVLLPAEVVGTGYESIVMPHQIRTVSKLRLLERIGILADQDRRVEIENRILEHLGIAFEAEEP